MRSYDFFRNVIRIGDVVLCGSVHSLKPHFYEVSSIDRDGWYSQPGSFIHRYCDILGVFRYDGQSLVSIWSPM